MIKREWCQPPRQRHWLAIWAGVLVTMLGTSREAEARSLGSLDFEPCTLAAGRGDAVDAQCTTLRVPENRAEPGGRQIELALAWVPSDSAEPEPDPVFLLAGGPGQAAREAYPVMADAFRDILRNRHVILLDQRGTGGSNPLACKDAAGNNAFSDSEDASPEAAADFARRCLAQLSERADVRFYTSTDAVADLDDVRQRIGAERINLYGGSYGTRMGQLYARTHPEHTRAVVLDSLAPMDWVLGSEHAQNLDANLASHWQRCRDVAACAKQLPDPAAAIAQVRARLTAPGRSAVRYRDPTSGSWRSEVPGFGHLAILLRLYAYNPATAALLPVILQQAIDGDDAPLLAQARLLMADIGSGIMHGMQLSVSCSEDADELSTNPADADTVMGAEFIAFTQAQCAVWPRGTRPADFRTPLTGSVPVLAVSGEFDPVTPPRNGEAVVSHLSNARHLVLKGQGHTPIGVGCMPKLFAQFIESADPMSLDTACLDRLAPSPPFVGLYGPEP